MTPHTEPGRLGFVTFVLSALDFLVDRGFRVVRIEETLVRFESETVYIQIFHGRYSFTLGVELGRLSVADEIFTLADAVDALCPSRSKEAQFQASNKEALGRGVSIFADLIRDCCTEVLNADSEAFKRVDDLTSKERRAATLIAQYGATRDKAVRAWEEKDYPEAYRLYSEMHEALTIPEKRRLEYLRSRLG